MTKSDIIKELCLREGCSKSEAAEYVETVFNTVKETLTQGAQVKIQGLGTFSVREKQPRVGRNPQTGERITISARRVVTFKTSKLLKEMLNAETVK